MASSSVNSSASSARSSLSSLPGGAGSSGSARSGDEVDWRERCQVLEASLVKFKQQASRIRELLSDKMREMERKMLDAEKRAETAEQRGHNAEGNDTGSSSSSSSLSEMQNILKKHKAQQEAIASLEAQLEQQKQLRLSDGKAISDKSAHIKQWVTTKMQSMEKRCERHKSEAESLRGQVEQLRERLQLLPPAAAREVHRISLAERHSRTESEIFEDVSPPVPKRPSSSILETFRMEQEMNVKNHGSGHDSQGSAGDMSPDTDDNMAVTDILEPDYQEIDDNHESKYEPKRTMPPQIRIERKVFNPQTHCSSVMSSVAGSEEALAKRVSQHTYAVPHANRKKEVTPANSQGEDSPPVSLTPKVPPSPLTPFLPDPPPNTPGSLYPYPEGHSTQTVSALATLPRRRKDAQRFFSRDYAVVGPEGTAFERSYSERGHIHGKPPTPPMRRLPSWENRIYDIANAGMRISEKNGLTNRESSLPVTDGLYMDQMFEDLTVPVYTTLKGKAAQIRSTPFTGDSSTDSSDNEEDAAMTTNKKQQPPDNKEDTRMGVGDHSAVECDEGVDILGGMKRGVSSHSITSETSGDYAVPPDDDVSIQNDSSGDSEPEQKMLKYTTENLSKDCLERNGYLTKLGGRSKNWKRRYFVLKGGELLYFKSHNDLVRKPQGYINLDCHTRIAKTEGAHTFEIVTSKKQYYLTAESMEDMDNWIRVLQNVLKKQATDRALGQSCAKEVLKGWAIKGKHGRSRRCWCVLMGKFFMYYKSPDDKTPLGQIHLRDARIEEVDRSCDSDSDSDDTGIPDYTLAIWTNSLGPTYLMIPTKHVKDSWLYHLTVAAGGGTGNVGTEFEQLVSKLMDVDGDPASVFWKHPVLLHVKEPLTKPLTTLPSEDLQVTASELFKKVQSFLAMSVDTQHVDTHVVLAHGITEMCLQSPDLQNELYALLIKQTSRHPPQPKSGVQNLLLCGSSSWFLCDAGTPTSPTNSIGDLTESKLNPMSFVLLQGWQLLAMAVSLFLPKQSILWLFKAHLQRNADPKTEMGKYAVFCQRALERVLHNGSREARPSRMEVLSILLRNPYHHSQPFSIPVHFLSGAYQVVSFDGSTTVAEFLHSLNRTLAVRDCALSGFCLFTDDPAGQELEHCLKTHLKLCDVIAKWEQAYLHHASRQSRCDANRTVKLTYKNRMYFRSLTRSETEKEKLLLAHQVNDETISGRFPLNCDLAREMSALMAQIEYSDFRTPGEMTPIPSPVKGGTDRIPVSSIQQLPLVVERFYPKRYRDGGSQEQRLLEQTIAVKWAALQGRSQQDCLRIYLTVARKWPFFGAKLFSAKVKFAEPVSSKVWLAVQEDTISILEYSTLKSVSTYPYKTVVTFGGCRDDFMLVMTHKQQTSPGQFETVTDRLMFVMTKPKILELTMLMASYINSKSQHRSDHSAVSSPSPGQRLHAMATAASRSPSHIPRYHGLYHTIDRVPRRARGASPPQPKLTTTTNSMES